LRFVAGVFLTLAVALLVFVWVMSPPSGELQAMAVFLSITALISVAAGYAAYRLGWLSRSPRLSWTLLAGYGLATVLTFLNVGYSGRRAAGLRRRHRHVAGLLRRCGPYRSHQRRLSRGRGRRRG
jgi:hypothetical protein